MRVLIAIPALNEAKVIASTVSAVRRFVAAKLPRHQFMVVVADNGSTDGTGDIVAGLASTDPSVVLLQLNERGKGRAIRAAWDAYEADAYVFMDADLAVDLEALPELIARLEQGADVVVGSRFHRDSVVRRSWLRRAMSLGYRAVLTVALETDVVDLPCGFKAVSSRVAREVMPAVADGRWFFDTELVIRAERAGLRVDEVPVKWSEEHPKGRVSKVHVGPLVHEYLGRVFALRRVLGTRHDAVEPTIVEVAPAERRLIIGAASLVALLGLIPPISASLWASQHGWEWTGRQFLAPADTAVYLHDIHQVVSGHALLRNGATTEHLVPVLNILWLFVGLIARVLLLTPIAAYHIARTLLIFPFAIVTYAASAYLFRGLRARAAAFVLVMFGGGLGLLVTPFLKVPTMEAGIYRWPIDMWVSEANAFMSMLYSPHFVASWTLFVAALVLLLCAYDRRSPRWGAYAGLAALLLFQFHPFHAPTLWLIAGLTMLAASWAEGFRLRRFYAFALFVLASAPSVAYHFWLTHLTSNARFMLHNNVNLTPPLPYVLLGLGTISVLAVFGWHFERTGRTSLLRPSARRFLVVWAIGNLNAAYMPFVFQRRLLEGLQFPLAMLAVPALAAFIAAWPFKGRERIVGLALAGALAFLPSTYANFHRSIDAARGNTQSPHFISAEQSAALAWIRKNTPQDSVVLSTVNVGNDIMGLAERDVFVGHWANTIDLDRKQREVRDFLELMTDAQRRAFVDEHGIDYVFVGPVERTYSVNLEPSRDWLWRVYGSGGYEVYAVMGERD